MPRAQDGTCSQTLWRRKNSRPYLPHRSCSNKTFTSRVVECILTVLALEWCPSLLSIQALFGAAGGKAASHRRISAEWAKWSKLCSSVLSATPGEQEKGGCPDYRLFNIHLSHPPDSGLSPEIYLLTSGPLGNYKTIGSWAWLG